MEDHADTTFYKRNDNTVHAAISVPTIGRTSYALESGRRTRTPSGYRVSQDLPGDDRPKHLHRLCTTMPFRERTGADCSLRRDDRADVNKV